jgi:hypothetical protein
LQRRRNHHTFVLHGIEADEHPDLIRRFAIEKLPTLLVVEETDVRARLEQPRGCVEIQLLLAPGCTNMRRGGCHGACWSTQRALRRLVVLDHRSGDVVRALSACGGALRRRTCCRRRTLMECSTALSF